MASVTTMTTDSSFTPRPPAKGLLLKLRAFPALVFLVSLIAVCATLVVLVLLYIFVILTDKSNVSVSWTAVTSDAEDDTTAVEEVHDQTTPHGGSTLATMRTSSTESAGTTAESATAADVSSSSDIATASMRENLTMTAEITAQPTVADDMSSSNKETASMHENLTMAAEITALPTVADDVSLNDTQPTDNHTEFPEYANESIATSTTNGTPSDRTEEAFTVTTLTDLVTFTETMNESYDFAQQFSKTYSPDLTTETDALSLSNDSNSLINESTEASTPHTSSDETESTRRQNILQINVERANVDERSAPLDSIISNVVIDVFTHSDSTSIDAALAYTTNNDADADILVESTLNVFRKQGGHNGDASTLRIVPFRGINHQ